MDYERWRLQRLTELEYQQEFLIKALHAVEQELAILNERQKL